MKKGIRKIISIIATLTMIFQIVMPIIPGLNSKVFAVENIDLEQEEISRNYEIKEEETWDVSKNEDGSVIAKWTLKDRTLRISGTGEMKDWEYNSKEDWHNTQYTKVIEKVMIENGITSIGYSAFKDCRSLESIEIPEGVTSIEYEAFRGCSSLESINIPEGIKTIRGFAFSGCSSLKSVEIPQSVTSIEYEAFRGCSSLESINISESVTSIGDMTFYGCSSLESINIPSSVKSIGYGTFASCNGLTSINIDEGNENYTSENGVLFDKAKNKIVAYPAGKKDIKEYTIPSSVTNIEASAFDGCSSLKSIVIPESVTRIGYRAFSECSSLTSINIPEGATSIGNVAFEGCSSLIIYVKADSEGHRYAEESKQGYILQGIATSISTNYEIEEEITWDISASGDQSIIAKWTLEDRTLKISGTGQMKNWNYDAEEDWHNTQYTNTIEKVIIKNGITSIGDRAFRRCSSLESIEIPESVTSIEYRVFEGCNSLETMTIPNSVTRIHWYTFSGCSSLKSVEIPESVISIEYPAFEGCSSLTSINVDEGNEKYISEDGILFDKAKSKIVEYPAGKKDIKEYTIPNTVTSIESGAFEDCNSLESITIPSSVTSIGSVTFSGCSSLESIVIPEGVISIENYTFQGCSSLESIKIPEGITSIGRETFDGCNSLTSINIPEGVTSIGDWAFRGCSNLESINVDVNNKNYMSEDGILFNKLQTEILKYPEGKKEKEYIIPEKVTSIGDYAFNECSSLKSINIPEGVTSIGRYAFSGCSSLKNITIPSSVTSIEERAFYECSSLKDINIPSSVINIGGIAAIDKTTIIYTKSNSEGHRYAEEGEKGYIIDEIVPALNVTYSTKNPTKENVTVTITSNEQIQSITGWVLSSDKKTLTKEYTANVKETIIVKDLAGNETRVTIEIDNIEGKPEITIGDINEDEKIDITDFLMLKRHLIAGNRRDWILTGNRLLAADMNENGKVDISDVLILKRNIINNL